MVYQHTLPVGTRIESYKVTGVLGVGGFGVTYKARDEQLVCDVAIKEYLPADIAVRNADGLSVSVKSSTDNSSYEHGLRRFLDEARALARFREPNIVRVTRYLEANGTAYFVMEYEEGEPLSQRVRRLVSLDEDACIAIAIPILHGLCAVHAKNFLHRDIKPANIYVRTDDSPVLIDFGAARESFGDQSRHMTGMVTHGYAPFEQYSPNGRQGPWTDIYALGATLYHCATGVAPPPAPERIAVLHEGAPDPVQKVCALLGNRFSRPFLNTLRMMLAPYAANRPQSSEAVLEMLSVHGRTTVPDTGVPTQVRPADEVDRTIVLDRDAAGDIAWQPEVLQAVEAQLELYVGPLAHILVRKMAATTRGINELTEQLSHFIPSEARQREFLDGVRQAITTGSSRMPPAPPAPSLSQADEPASTPSVSAVQFEPAVLAAAEQALAVHLGPVAKILVKKASRVATDVDDLLRRLADELPNASQRQAFVGSARMRH
jgi:serine/threonine protein kinase